MELKEYQQSVLQRVDHFLRVLAAKREDAQDFVAFQKSKGKTAQLPNYCQEAWEQLNQERVIPWLQDDKGEKHAAPYLSRRDGMGHPLPSVCLKVPTGGGKTLLAAAILERIQTDYLKRQSGFVLWVVPSDAIYTQTWKHLANREHPYRQILERASGGRVKLMEKGDAFNRQDVETQLCVMLLMLPSAAKKSKDALRMFRDSGRFTSFFPVEDDSLAQEALLKQVCNLDRHDLADAGYANTVSLKQSLGNVLRMVRPVIVVDEGHKAYSETARDTLSGFNPAFIAEFSATPNTNGNHQSNVLINVPGTDLKAEEMIKLPINVFNEDKGGWKNALTIAHAKLAELAKDAQVFQGESGRYIRPIMLVRVERTGKDQRDAGFVHAEDAREFLTEKLGVKAEEIRLKTSDSDELGDDDLLAETCRVRYIITKDALREGWDCPFAYCLAILSKTTAQTALTQMIGRVLRQPHARRTGRALLDECFVFTFDQDVTDAVDGVRKGLQDEGMADLAGEVRAMNPADGKGRNARVETLRRREKFRELKIFLPRILHKSDASINAWRALDYDRDILGELDWAGLRYLHAGDLSLSETDRLTRTVARVNIERKADRNDAVLFETRQESAGMLPEEGLDIAFLVRQLLDVIPNPWQGMRILEETLAVLRARGVSEDRLYANRLDLIQDMKVHLKAAADAAAETLFKSKLNAGRISLRLAASDNAHLNWAMAQTMEIELSDGDGALRRKSGDSLEKSVFETVLAREFNNLEKETAWYLDNKECIHWWHRIAVKQSSYSLQGWQRQKVYPDLLACVQEASKDKFRFLVLETKGEHLKGNDDTVYKRKLFDLLTSSAQTAQEVGEFETGIPSMNFRMLMQDGWQGEMEAVFQPEQAKETYKGKMRTGSKGK